MDHDKKPVTRAMFEKNLAEKLDASHFPQDIGPFLAPHIQWDFQQTGCQKSCLLYTYQMRKKDKK